MTYQFYLKNRLKHLLLVAVMAMQLSGCLPWNESSTYSNQISGSVGDGPVTGADVDVYSTSGVLLGTIVSDSSATYSMLVTTEDEDYPLRLVASGGTDLVTGRAPDFEMVSVITGPRILNANINPFSTLIVKTAESMPGGLNTANVAAVQTVVMERFGFGLDSSVVPDPVTTVVDGNNVAHIVKASEVFGEMVRRTRDLMAGAGSPVDGDAVIAALAADLADGALDGQGGSGVDAILSAVANLVSGQVLLEAASNNLKVGGAVATQVMDQSIISTRAGVPVSRLTGSVPVSQALLDQLLASLTAIQVLDGDPAIAGMVTAVATLPAGSLAEDVTATLPASGAGLLDNALSLAPVANTADIDAINQLAASGGDDTVADDDPPPTVNTPPSISGSAAGSVFSNSSYLFQPSASDADGDTLSFSIVNKPSWATFNASTGRLSGMPADSHAGSYGNIVISVSDGSDTVSLPGFSIEVVAAPLVNTAPVISGSPAGLVTAGNGYLFQPSATDADGDVLTFGILNKPSWAGFNTANGTLSGTPGDADAGFYGNITITVSDGMATASLPGFSIQVDPALGSFSLGWTAPVARTDGAALSLSEISAYRVYYGPAPGNYTGSVTINNGSATSTVINNVPAGTWYVAMTTVDSNGVESAQSAAITKVSN